MKKNYKYMLLDLLKEYREVVDDEFLLCPIEGRINIIIDTINPLDYLIYEGRKKDV